jgi:hypothetical protein
MTRALSLVVGVILLAVPADAAETGRYVLKDVEAGFIRLDTGTGAVSLCRSQNEQWRCEPVADAEIALQDEITRLAEENAALRQKLAELTGPQEQRGLGPTLELPSEEDVDRIFGILERFMRRFIDFARSLNEDPGRET